MNDAAQVWTLRRDGRAHRVEATGSGSHHVRWLVDDAQVAEKKAWEEKLTLGGGELGTVVVRFSTLGRPRRATLFAAGEDAQALTGIGGVDLVPEPDSAAAAHEERVRRHPTRYAALATAGGVAKVIVPLVLGLVAVRFAVDLPWPGLPDLPLPDLPDVPWPDLPTPDLPLPDPDLPAWVREALDKAKYVWPVLLALVLARAEIGRRRKQDALRREEEGRNGED